MKKAFDSLDRETLWKLLRQYGTPEKITNLIKKMYENMSCKIIHEGQLTEPFEIKTGVRQGCLPLPFLFLLAIDWIMSINIDRKKEWNSMVHESAIRRPGLC